MRLSLLTIAFSMFGCSSMMGVTPPDIGGSADTGTPSSNHDDVHQPALDASSIDDAGNPITDDSGSMNNGTPPNPTATGCMTMNHDTAKVENSNADTFKWFDAACKARAASLLKNNSADAFGEQGGYLRAYSYEAGGKTRACKGTGANGWQGFGYIVNHYASSASTTQHVAGQTNTRLDGKHHVVHEFKWRVNPGAPVDVTAEWRVSTGRDHPLFAITFDSTPAGKDVANADTRAPYGDMAFEGTAGSIDGIGWGDKYKFTTKASPVTANSAWDYTQPNTIPYDLSWVSKADAEMGLVATSAFDVNPSGGDYGGGILSQRWGKSGSSLLNDLNDWTWPYQLNQYELPFGTTSHRIAWGANYGAVGKSSFTSFGRKLVGYPYTSYSLYVVFGTHAQSAVAAQVAEMETILKSSIAATVGTIDTKAVGGPGRTDEVTLSKAGFDSARGAWSAHAASNNAKLQFTASGTLVNPLIVIRDWTAASPKLSWNNASLTADTHYFATVDGARKELWITLNFAVTKGELAIAP